MCAGCVGSRLRASVRAACAASRACVCERACSAVVSHAAGRVGACAWRVERACGVARVRRAGVCVARAPRVASCSAGAGPRRQPRARDSAHSHPVHGFARAGEAYVQGLFFFLLTLPPKLGNSPSFISRVFKHLSCAVSRRAAPGSDAGWCWGVAVRAHWARPAHPRPPHCADRLVPTSRPARLGGAAGSSARRALGGGGRRARAWGVEELGAARDGDAAGTLPRRQGRLGRQPRDEE